MKENVKEDLDWLPSFDPEFKRYLKQVVMEQGWPKGPIDASWVANSDAEMKQPSQCGEPRSRETMNPSIPDAGVSSRD